ncbi:MAG: hypothetical protein ABJE95_17410 [Byssovorax sp.]
MTTSPTLEAVTTLPAANSRRARRLFRGLLTSAVVSASLTAMAGTARASVATVSGTKTISKTATSTTTKSTKYGSFGAGYTADFTMFSNDTGSSKSQSAEAKASATLFGTGFDMVGISATASSGLTSTAKADYVFTVLGASLKTGTSATISSGAWGTLAIDVPCVTFASIEEDMVIGVVPVTMSLEATGCPDLSLTAKSTYSSSSSSLDATITPSFAVDLTAGVGVGSGAFSVGAEVSVDLITVSLPVTNTMSFVPSTKALTYTTTGTLTLESLAGSISLYAKALFLKYTYTLFNWDGIGGSWTIFSDSVPTASGAIATVAEHTATGTYSYVDPSSLSDQGSTYTWYRASDASGTGSTSIATTQSWELTASDSNNYLKFCVKPKNGVNTGTEACSGWSSVGHLASFYENGSFSGTYNLSVAYERSVSGTCINVNTSAFNDKASSLRLYAPTSTSATMWLFTNADCSGSSTSFSASANASNELASMNGSLGSAWNDSLSSIMVIYGETVSAEDVTTTIAANKATGSYSYVSNSSLDEATPTYYWRRASSSSGTGATTISNSNSSSYTLTTSDNAMYLSFCVTPTNGYTSGSATCSDWTSVGHLVEFFNNSNYGSSSVVFAYEKSSAQTCFNLPNYSFNDVTSSFKFYGTSSAASTLVNYYDGSCSGNAGYYTASAGGSYLNASVGDYWNDNISSFKVFY